MNTRPFIMPAGAQLQANKGGQRSPPLVLKELQHPEPMVDEQGNPITVINAKDNHCRYVHGEPGTDGFRYCGHPVWQMSFCKYHAAQCFDPAYLRRIG